MMFKLKESYRRKLLLADAKTQIRKRRSAPEKLPQSNSIEIEFRTRKQDGILMFAEDVTGNFTVLHVSFVLFSIGFKSLKSLV